MYVRVTCVMSCRRKLHVLVHVLSLYHNCDSTTIRRYHNAFDYDGSDRNYSMRSIRLRYDYDEKLTCSFFACVELEADARDMM